MSLGPVHCPADLRRPPPLVWADEDAYLPHARAAARRMVAIGATVAVLGTALGMKSAPEGTDTRRHQTNETSAEQALGDDHPLDLVGALVDLGGLVRPSGPCSLVSESAPEQGRQSAGCWPVLSGAGPY